MLLTGFYRLPTAKINFLSNWFKETSPSRSRCLTSFLFLLVSELDPLCPPLVKLPMVAVTGWSVTLVLSVWLELGTTPRSSVVELTALRLVFVAVRSISGGLVSPVRRLLEFSYLLLIHLQYLSFSSVKYRKEQSSI